jgi:hypothetical protein
MMDVFSGITRMNPNHFGICSSFQLLGSGRPDEYLGRRYKARNVDEVAQGRNLGNCLDGTLTEDGEETC